MSDESSLEANGHGATANTEDNTKFPIEEGLDFKKPTFPLRVSPVQTRSRSLTKRSSFQATGILSNRSKTKVSGKNNTLTRKARFSTNNVKTKIKDSNNSESGINITRHSLRSRNANKGGKVKENTSNLPKKSSKAEMENVIASTSKDSEVDNKSDLMNRRKLKLTSKHNKNFKSSNKKIVKEDSINHLEAKNLSSKLACNGNKAEDTQNIHKALTRIENESSSENEFLVSEDQKDPVSASEAGNSRNKQNLAPSENKSSLSENGLLLVYEEQKGPVTTNEAGNSQKLLRKNLTQTENESSSAEKNRSLLVSEEPKDPVTVSEAGNLGNIQKDLTPTEIESSLAENDFLLVSEEQNCPITASELGNSHNIQMDLTPMENKFLLDSEEQKDPVIDSEAISNKIDTFPLSEHSIDKKINGNAVERDECSIQTKSLKSTTEIGKTNSFSVKPEENKDQGSYLYLKEEQNIRQDLEIEIPETTENFIKTESESGGSSENRGTIYFEEKKNINEDQCVKTNTSESNSIIRRGNRKCYSLGNFHYEYMRLKTFKNRSYSIGNCRLFSECGLVCIYYAELDESYDIMYCGFCSMIFPNYDKCTPIDGHKFINPNCDFFSNFILNVPLSSGKEGLTDNESLEDLNKFLETYLIYRTTCTSLDSTLSSEIVFRLEMVLGEEYIRIHSKYFEKDYCKFLQKIYKKVDEIRPYFETGLKLKNMAEAGFFTTGLSDLVVCFKCNGGLMNWENTDDPIREHARFFPSCKFVANFFSQFEINQMSEELECLKSGIPEREVALTPAELDLLLEHPLSKKLTEGAGADRNFLRGALRNFVEKHAMFPTCYCLILHIFVDFGMRAQNAKILPKRIQNLH